MPSLSRWDDRIGLRVKDVANDRLTIELDAVPEDDVDGLYDEIVAPCPEAAEDEKALKRQLAKKGSILLWFD